MLLCATPSDSRSECTVNRERDEGWKDVRPPGVITAPPGARTLLFSRPTAVGAAVLRQ